MKLFYISRTDATSYDEYDSAVVAAETEQDAQKTHPAGEYEWNEETERWVRKSDRRSSDWGEWLDPKKVEVEYIGEAKKGTKAGVICASFNAG